MRAVLQDAVRHGVVERNVSLDPETLVRESGPTRSFLEPFQVSALLDAGALLQSEHRGLTWDDVHAIRASTASNVALACRYRVSDSLISKIRRRQLWATNAQRNRNDIPRVVLLATLVAAGLRISELCLLDGEDLDFAEAAEGTRTLDLLHGKQSIMATCTRFLPANEAVPDSGDPRDMSRFVALCRVVSTNCQPV